eukprot:9748185-Lingulodinium_polyedra.AAC.1
MDHEQSVRPYGVELCKKGARVACDRPIWVELGLNAVDLSAIRVKMQLQLKFSSSARSKEFDMS